MPELPGGNLEHCLRESMRAHTPANLPSPVFPAIAPSPSRAGRPWVMPLVSTAGVAALTATVMIFAGRIGAASPDAGRPMAPVSGSAAVPSVSAVPAPARACNTVPAAFGAVKNTHRWNYTSPYPIGVSSSGETVVSIMHDGKREVVLNRPGRSTIQLMTLSDPIVDQAYFATVNDRMVMFDVSHGLEDGGVEQLHSYDRATGKQRAVVDPGVGGKAPVRQLWGPAVVLGDKAYWLSAAGNEPATLRQYDIVTGAVGALGNSHPQSIFTFAGRLFLINKPDRTDHSAVSDLSGTYTLPRGVGTALAGGTGFTESGEVLTWVSHDTHSIMRWNSATGEISKLYKAKTALSDVRVVGGWLTWHEESPEHTGQRALALDLATHVVFPLLSEHGGWMVAGPSNLVLSEDPRGAAAGKQFNPPLVGFDIPADDLPVIDHC